MKRKLPKTFSPHKQIQNQSEFLQSNLSSEETIKPGRKFKQFVHLDKKQESFNPSHYYTLCKLYKKERK